MRNAKVRMLVESAVMVALAFVLSLIKVWQMPFGGSVTLLSMLPITLIAVKNGPLWGFGTAFVYSLTQLAVSGVFGWGLTAGVLAVALLLDYIAAFTVLGAAGCFGKTKTGAVVGTAVACVLRFVSHFLAGYTIWANYEQFVAFGKEWVNMPALYSLCYNGAYMLPELIFTVAATVVFVNVPAIQKLLGLTK